MKQQSTENTPRASPDYRRHSHIYLQRHPYIYISMCKYYLYITKHIKLTEIYRYTHLFIFRPRNSRRFTKSLHIDKLAIRNIYIYTYIISEVGRQGITQLYIELTDAPFSGCSLLTEPDASIYRCIQYKSDASIYCYTYYKTDAFTSSPGLRCFLILLSNPYT